MVRQEVIRRWYRAHLRMDEAWETVENCWYKRLGMTCREDLWNEFGIFPDWLDYQHPSHWTNRLLVITGREECQSFFVLLEEAGEMTSGYVINTGEELVAVDESGQTSEYTPTKDPRKVWKAIAQSLFPVPELRDWVDGQKIYEWDQATMIDIHWYAADPVGERELEFHRNKGKTIQDLLAEGDERAKQKVHLYGR